jgi:hypothetical protein
LFLYFFLVSLRGDSDFFLFDPQCMFRMYVVLHAGTGYMNYIFNILWTEVRSTPYCSAIKETSLTPI